MFSRISSLHILLWRQCDLLTRLGFFGKFLNDIQLLYSTNTTSTVPLTQTTSFSVSSRLDLRFIQSVEDVLT